MMSAHWMMVSLVILGCVTTLAVIIIAVIESHRTDKSKTALSNDEVSGPEKSSNR